MDFNINSAHERRLRGHIHEVLLPYARTHITSDHIAYTEKLLEELLHQTLEHVPIVDTSSFQLPTEPLEVLMRSLDYLDLSPPEEKWVTPAGHVKYLRTFFPPPLDPRDLQIEKCWHGEDPYMKVSLMCRPISPSILSRRAKRETRKLGGTCYRNSIPCANPTLVASYNLGTLLSQDTDDLPVPSVEDVLNLRLEPNSMQGACPPSYLLSISGPSVVKGLVGSFEDTPNVPEFLKRQSPPRYLSSLDSPPLFPRVLRRRSTLKKSRGGPNKGVGNPARVPDLVYMLRAATPELIHGEDGNINDHHMELVDGQSSLSFSSPPPPCLRSSDGSEVDELWEVSSSGTPATSLVAAKMEEVEIPRIRKFGHKNTVTNEGTNHSDSADLLTVVKSPGFFITSFISAPVPMAQVDNSITSQLGGVNSSMHSPRPFSPGQSTSNSLLGQPPSAPSVQDGEISTPLDIDPLVNFEEQPFDDVVASIYAATPQDSLSFIKEEKLDDKDFILMDVPDLPPPTIHPKELLLFPKRMQGFIIPKGEPDHFSAIHGAMDLGYMRFLRPVKGIKPLALDLSWRPFNFGKMIPTDEDVSGIAKAIEPEDETPGYRDGKYKKAIQDLLDLGTVLKPAEDIQVTLFPHTPRGCEKLGTSPTHKQAEENGQVGYLLTQRERHRASVTKITLNSEVELQNDEAFEQDTAYDNGHEDVLARDGRTHHEERQGSQNPSDLTEHYFDDSGITIMNNNLGHFSASEPASAHILLHSFQDDQLSTVDVFRENKENSGNRDVEDMPSREVDFQLAECEQDSPIKPSEWSSYFNFPDSLPFEPLSFSSQNQLPGHPVDLAVSIVQDVHPLILSDYCVEFPEDNLISTGEREQTSFRAKKRRKLDNLVPASSKDLFSTFIGLRNQAPSSRAAEQCEVRDDIPTLHQLPEVPEQILPRVVPDDVFDQNTVQLPEHWIPTAAIHRYLVSMNLIQKRALVCELQGHRCQVILVERNDLRGTDVIVDLDYGALFVPLLALPANIESAVERISGESWRYSNLLVVFEAFPSTQSYRADRSRVTGVEPSAYTPPICKAIKKLRRTLGIAEGCGTMSTGCKVTWAFANDPEEAAKFVRCFGEEACAKSIEGDRKILWDGREWLEEEKEGEMDLAKVHGMNAFAALIMLYNRSLEALLDLSPEARLAEYGPLLGQERVMGLNAVIEGRLREVVPDITNSEIGPEH